MLLASRLSLHPSSTCRVALPYPQPQKPLQNPTLPWLRSMETFVSLRVSRNIPQRDLDHHSSNSAVPPSAPGSTASALSAVDVNIFAHEFINIFRFSHRAIVHPTDIHVINPVSDDSVRCEEETQRVFLSKDVMERFSKLTVYRPVRPIRSRQHRIRYAHRSTHTPPISQLSVSYPLR